MAYGKMKINLIEKTALTINRLAFKQGTWLFKRKKSTNQIHVSPSKGQKLFGRRRELVLWMWPRLLLVVCSVRSKTIILVFRYYSREHWFLWTSDPQFVTSTAARKRLWHSPSSSDFVCDQKEKTEHVSKLVTVFTKLHMRALAYSIQGMQAEGPKELINKETKTSK